MAKVRVNGDGWAKIGSAYVGAAIMTAFGAGSLRDAAVIVPASWLLIFVLTGGKPTRVMTSDMLDGLDEDETEAHDRRAKQLGWLIGTVFLIGLVYWVWKTTPE